MRVLPPDEAAVFAARLSDEDMRWVHDQVRAEDGSDRWASLAADFPVAGDSLAWPPGREAVLGWRTLRRAELAAEAELAVGARAYYADHVGEFIDHWCITYDPRLAGRRGPDGRALATRFPFILFPRQRLLVDFFLACLAAEESGLVEKCRDMGATWVACGVSVALWLFWPGAAIGWGSRKEELVDKIGDPKSVFEKMRMIVRDLPPELLPDGFAEAEHMHAMKFVNPATGATITGEAGDNIGRGGRTLIYFKDESAHYERPEKIEAALADNSRVQMDISSVNGLGTVFHRRREAGRDWAPGEAVERGRTAVFVMDWRDHPEKDEAWYERRRRKAADDGLLHVFAREVDRDYAASVEGVIIPAEWVRSAIDAHLLLGFDDDGPWSGALDVADGGGDVNADAWFKGPVLRALDAWTARDTGETTRRFLDHAEGKGPVEAQYDAGGGYGSGIKAEANRLAEAGELSPLVRLVPWVGAAAPLDPDEPVIEGDRDSPANRDYYENLKAQAWWRTRMKFERTHRAVLAKLGKGEAFTWEPSSLISLDSRLPLLRRLEKELSQPTRKAGARRLVVDKIPEGARSPNLADAMIMADNPGSGLRPVIAVARGQFETAAFKLPGHFRKGFAMAVTGQRAIALWAAYDADADMLYFTTEYVRDYAEPAVHALAIAARGRWIPGIFDCDSKNPRHFDELMRLYHGLGLPILSAAGRAVEAGVADLQQRISTGRLKVFSTCQDFFADYRAYRRGADGGLIGGGLMDCARQLARPDAIGRMAVEPGREGRSGGARGTPNLYRG